MLAEALFFVFYVIAIVCVFLLVEKVIRNRYGDYVADDKLTRAGVFALSVVLLVGGVQLLAWITGHLSGRL